MITFNDVYHEYSMNYGFSLLWHIFQRKKQIAGTKPIFSPESFREEEATDDSNRALSAIVRDNSFGTYEKFSFGFLMFSEGIKWEDWLGIGQMSNKIAFDRQLSWRCKVYLPESTLTLFLNSFMVTLSCSFW